MTTKQFHHALQRLAYGEKAAMEELFVGCNEKLICSAFLILHDKQKAVNVADDILIRLFQKPYDYLNIYNPDAWLFTSARNAALNLLKKDSRMIFQGELTLPGADRGPEQDEWIDFYSLLTKHFDEREQRLIVLRVVYDQTYRKIAKSEDMTIGQVVWTFKRIKSCLERVLK